MLLAVLPGQVTFLLVAIGVAFSDSRDWRHRLGFLPGELPKWTWGVLAVATPTVALVSSLLMAAFREPSEHLKSLERMFTAQQGWRLGFVVLLVSVLPGICEELLFRGMLQRRLLIRWTPLAAILVSSLFFAAAHMDPMHAAGVLPLGLWLGIVAWRCNSLWPAMLCHVTNNALAILLSHAPSAGPIVLPISCLTMIFAVGILRRGPGKMEGNPF